MTCINCDGQGSERCDHYGCEYENDEPVEVEETPDEFWHGIEGQLWNMIGEINQHYYSRPHHVDNFAAALAMTNKILKLVQQNPPPFKGRPSR